MYHDDASVLYYKTALVNIHWFSGTPASAPTTTTATSAAAAAKPTAAATTTTTTTTTPATPLVDAASRAKAELERIRASKTQV